MSVTEEDLDIAASYVGAVLTELTKRLYPVSKGRKKRPRRATPFDCPFCGEAITTGVKITRLGKVWAHEKCWLTRKEKRQ